MLTIGWNALPGVDGDGRMGMRFGVRVDHGVVIASVDGAALEESQAAVLDMLIGAAQAVAAQQPGAIRPLTGPTGVPDAAMALAWARPRSFRLTASGSSTHCPLAST